MTVKPNHRKIAHKNHTAFKESTMNTNKWRTMLSRWRHLKKKEDERYYHWVHGRQNTKDERPSGRDARSQLLIWQPSDHELILSAVHVVFIDVSQTNASSANSSPVESTCRYPLRFPSHPVTSTRKKTYTTIRTIRVKIFEPSKRQENI